MSTDNKGYTGVFGEFSSGDFSGPKNITSDMWTPISVSPDSHSSDHNRRYVPQDRIENFGARVQNNRQGQHANNRPRQPRNGQAQGQRPISQGREPGRNKKAAPPSGQRNGERQQRPQHGGDVPPRTGKKQPDRQQDRPNRNPQQQRTDRQRPQQQRSQQRPPEQRPQQGRGQRTSGEQRNSKGRDPRNAPAHAKQTMSQREIQMHRQNRKNVNRSNDHYDERINNGISHNEIVGENAEKKKKSRKRNNIAIIIAAVVFVACFICILVYSNGAPIQNIIVEGDCIYTDKQIIYVSEIKTGDNMLGIKKKQVGELIETKLPYISDALVDFTIPDTVTITVTPTTDKIFINNKSNYICLDSNDKIVSMKKKKLSPGLFRVDGFDVETVTQGTVYVPSETNTERFEITKKIVSCFEENSMDKAAIITVTDLNDVQVIYDARIRIYLGKCEDLQSQLSLVIQTIKHSASGTQKGYIDMRYSNTAYFSEGSMDA